MKKQQASLLSFFGKPKKKLRLNDDESNNQQKVIEKEEIKESSNLHKTVEHAKSEAIKESINHSDNNSTSNDEIVVEKAAAPTTAALQDGKEQDYNDTDTTQSKESDDSDSSSSSDEEEEDDDDDDSKQPPTPTTSFSDTSSNSNSNPHQKSDYELMRERNIARNNARLKALGLFVESTDVGSSESTTKKKQRRRTKAAKVSNKAAITEPTRRSSRLSGVKMNYTDESSDHVMNQEGSSFKEQAINDNDVEVKEEEKYKVSPLFDYQMNDGGTSLSSATTTTTAAVASELDCNVSNNDKIKTLVPSGKRLVPPAGLNAIYSLQFYNAHHETTIISSSTLSSSSWLVGAGKSGLIAVWDCNNSSRTAQEEDQISYVEPVLSWKGHGGRWIADARFVLPPIIDSSSNDDAHVVPSRLLTAGNDGTVCHWDLSTTSLTTGAPRLLHQTNKSLHASGIFSMDVKAQQDDCSIVTGSKDKSIAVSKLSRLADGEGATWRSNFHTAKVASVSFSSSVINPLIASASDDGLVAIHDMRLNGSDSSSSVVASLENSHVRPHSAVWKPSSDSIFVTAGLDDVIKIWDLRNTSKPVLSFHGHVPSSGKKLKRIHRPTFFTVGCCSDPFILSGGENSHAISMFQVDEEGTNNGLRTVFSRGKLPDGSGDVGSMAVYSNQVAVTVEGGEVIVLTPKA
jgi:WD40 repeat protein